MPRRSGCTKVRGPLTSRPSISTRPEVGASTPAAMRRSVVLPQPEWPSRQTSLARLDGQRDAVERAHGCRRPGRCSRRRAGPGSRRPPCRAGPSGAAGTGRGRSRRGVERHSSSRPRSGACPGAANRSSVERILVLAQGVVVGGHRHGEAGGHAAFQEARALQLLEARQVVDGVEAEMLEEAGVVP